MSSDNETNATNEAPADGQVPDATNEENNTTTEQATESTKKDDVADLPEWARNERTRLNHENAEWRRKYRDLESALEGRKTAEEVQAVVDGYQSQVKELERTLLQAQVAAEFNLPASIADRLRGDDRDSLVEDAKALQALVASVNSVNVRNGGDPSGGLDPSKHTVDYSGKTPGELAAMVRRKR